MNTYLKKQKIIIDTDPGHDDALAIILAEKSKIFNIMAITTVAGNSTIQNTTNNARFILDLIDSDTKLYSGAKKPLKQELIQAVVHGDSGLDGIKIAKQEKLTNEATNKIIQIIKNNPKEVTILALGPLTNIAQAFTKEPSIIPLIKEVIIMGGAINVPGNKNRVAEFNLFVDPEAADIVFKTNIKKVLVPLDLCNSVFFSLKDFEKLKGTSLCQPVYSMMEKYIKGIYTFERTKGAIMYDPVAAYFLINPLAFTITEMDVQIETQGNLTRGMTVADKRLWGAKKMNVLVTQSLDKNQFKKDFFEIFSDKFNK